MKKISIGVFGAGGRMGQEVCQLILTQKEFTPAVAISREKPLPEFKINSSKINDKLVSAVDVWIDFSLPQGFEEILIACCKAKKPLVSGTTGLSEKQKKKLKSAGKIIPVLWSSNMSLGIVALKKAMQSLALLDGFDFQIEEFHHNQKKDRPSGTAISLQNELIQVTGKKNIADPISVRGGGIFGIHRVFAMSQEEVITFEHQALNRQVFARGAIWAAKELSVKSKGLYSIEDLVKWP